VPAPISLIEHPRTGRGVRANADRALRLFRSALSEPTDARRRRYDEASSMRTTYGVVWREGSRPSVSGKLELLPRAIRLDGRNCGYEIPYADVIDVRVGRAAAERIDGRRSLVIERDGCDPVAITTVSQAALLGEIVERLTESLASANAQRDEEPVSFLPTPGAGDSDGGDIY
jgi:hypothetical protein